MSQSVAVPPCGAETVNVNAALNSADAPERVATHEDEQPTASHALAEESLSADPNTELDDVAPEKGSSQLEHGEAEVKDLGWNEHARDVPVPLVGGLKNEEMWTLVRRFNGTIFQVRSIKTAPLADLDMNIAEDEEFSPEKLRAQMERFYMSVMMALLNFWKHIVRLRSWREWKRTSVFLAVYSAAWLLDLVVPTLVAFAMVLTLHPPAREHCFPPVPPSIIDSGTGGVKKPAAGVLATADSATGAPEKHEGEAVEQEAHNFVNSTAAVFSGLVIGTSAGKRPPGDARDGDARDDDSTPDPTVLTQMASDARDATEGVDVSTAHDQTKRPVSQAVWERVKPTMTLLADFVDTWERFANALSPTPPFPRRRPRLVMASCLLPLLVGSSLTSSYMLLKGVGFGVGFAFFGDPIIARLIALTNRTYPQWQKYVELRHTILRGIPTNAQLTITLLRIGERNKAPLPPPPSSDVAPPVAANPEAVPDAEQLGTSHLEVEAAAAPDPNTEVAPAIDGGPEKHKKSRRIVDLLKGVTKGGIRTALAADKAKAKAGATQAKNRLGVVEKEPLTGSGPVCFPARYRGTKGQAYITATATTPALSWTTDHEPVSPAWTVAIGDLEGLEKVGGLGWKSKMVVGWAMGTQVRDGLVVKTKGGEEFHLTAIGMRDELFNRLIAMGSQMWEAL